ncbi:MAG: hypothetical protein KGJ54_06545 [Betaproteobacteria bacterium]|nr:hypothetical protein [Betaproteobacteria bacterium]
MSKAARQKQREVNHLVEIWGPRARGVLCIVLMVAAAVLVGGTASQHAVGRNWLDAVFGALPLSMLALSLGLAPILALVPLALFERRLKIETATAHAAALKISGQLLHAAKVARAVNLRQIDKIAKFLARFLASISNICDAQTRVFLTPRILSQRPIYPRVPRG